MASPTPLAVADLLNPQRVDTAIEGQEEPVADNAPENSNSDGHATNAESAVSDLSINGYHVGLMEDLCASLDNIQGSGSFAAWTADVDLGVEFVPDLFVHDVGPISLPLEEGRARQVIEKARQAPFGRGSETIVDISVRNTWELDPSQFQIRHPDWEKALQTCRGFVAKSLGISVPITSELYKMLIYEKGAFFKPHTDTEKIPGMFGTMVICLGSEHEGGDVIVKHQGKTIVLESFDGAVLCWYSDVSHEVWPVTSGYRLVLTYNLAIAHAPLQPPTASLLTSGARQLRHTLRRYLENHRDGADEPDKLYYLLDHMDLLVARTLASIGEEIGLDIFLAILEKSEIGTVEEDDYHSRWGWRGRDEEDEDAGEGEKEDESWHSLDEILDSGYQIKKLVDLDGQVVRTEIDIKEDVLMWSLIQDYGDPFENAARGESSYNGYMGNSGPEATHWYRTAAIIIVPRGEVSDAFVLESINETSAESLLLRYSQRSGDAEVSARMIGKLMKACWPVDKSWSGEDTESAIPRPYYGLGRYGYTSPRPRVRNLASAEAVLRFALNAKNYELFNTAISHVQNRVKPLFFSFIGGLLAENGGEGVDFTKVKPSFQRYLDLRSIADRFQFVQCLLPPDGVVESQHMRDWISGDITTACIEACRIKDVGEGDATAFMSLVCLFHSFGYIKENIFPLVEEMILRKPNPPMPFVLTVIQHIIGAALDGTFDRTETLALCKPILKSAIVFTELVGLQGENNEQTTEPLPKTPRTGYNQAAPQTAPQKKQPKWATIQPDRIVTLFDQCIKCSWDDLLMQLSLKLASAIDNFKAAEFRTLWIPFLHSLITVLESNHIPLTTPRYQQIACAILETYIQKGVGKEPPASDPGYAVPPVVCFCSLCTRVNEFLSSDGMTQDFICSPTDLRHLHAQLLRSRSPCNVRERPSNEPGKIILTVSKPRLANPSQDTWQKKFRTAQDDIAAFPQDKLKLLLGEEYDQITEMRQLKLSAMLPTPLQMASLVQRPASSNAQAQTQPAAHAGVKRPADRSHWY